MKRWKVYMLCAVCVLCIGLLTGCGARDKNGTVNTERNTGALNSERADERQTTDDDLNDGVNDATGDEITPQDNMTDDSMTDNNDTGIGNAVEDLADGVGDAGKDIVEGIGEAGDSLMGDNGTDQTNQTNQNEQGNNAAGME